MMVSLKKLVATAFLAAFAGNASADVMLDVRNDTSEECSLAFNFRVDKAKWVTVGWYVFDSAEEAPVILKGIDDARYVYVYNDCRKTPYDDKSETKKSWVKSNKKFYDDVPRDHETGYEEVVFERLKNDKYIIQN